MLVKGGKGLRKETVEQFRPECMVWSSVGACPVAVEAIMV